MLRRVGKSESSETIAANKPAKTRKQAQIEKFIVHKLTNFLVDFDGGPKAVVEYCGEIAFAGDPGPEIQDRFVAGHGYGYYKITKQMMGGKMGGSHVINISAPAAQYYPEQQNEPGAPRPPFILTNPALDSGAINAIARLAAQEVRSQMPAQPEQPTNSGGDAFEEFMRQAERIESFKSKFMPNAPAATTSQEKPFEERLIETAMVKILELNPDGKTLDKVLEVLGGGKKEPSIFESLGELVKPMIPVLGEFAMKYLAGQQPAPAIAQPQPAQVQGPINGTGQPPPQPERSPEQKAVLKLIQRIQEDMEEALPHEAVAASFDNFIIKYPDNPLVNLLLTAPAQSILAQLGVSATFEAVQWITDLQTELKDVGDVEGEQVASAGAPAG